MRTPPTYKANSPVRVEIVKSEILIKQKDFLFYENEMKKSCSFPQVSQLHRKFTLYKEGNCTYSYLYRGMKRIVVGGHSTFKSMEELAEAVERDCWYHHNYGDTDYWKKEENNNENKIQNPISGRPTELGNK